MKSRKDYIFIIIAICAVCFISGAIFIISRQSGADENAITRYEWLEMLGEQSGVKEYTNEVPYFKDVDADNTYFAYVQSAVEWEVIEAGSKFDGEDYADGHFIALTAMKTIGESKFRICFGTEDAITDNTYIEFAVEHGLIEEEKLKKGFSKEECEQVLENLKSLYFGVFWKDDYANVVYQEGVIELSPTDVLQSNDDCSQITVGNDVADSLEVGTIIVFEQEKIKFKLAREITGINSDGTLSLSVVKLDKVVESLMVSDITELTFEDIVNYYALDEKLSAVNNLKYQQAETDPANIPILSGAVNSKGYKISFVTDGEGEDRCLKGQITNNDTGVSYEFPVDCKVESDEDEYSAEIDIDKIYIGAQIDFSLIGGLKYAEAAVDVHATFKSEIKADAEKKFLLFRTPVPLGDGFTEVNIEVYIVLSVDGSISFQTELPVEISVKYEKNKGLRSPEHSISIKEPTIEINCNAGVALRIEPILAIFGFDVMDVEGDIGVAAGAKTVMHANRQTCIDISVSFPVVTISVCNDDDIDTMIGELGLSAEWEIISEDNAPLQAGYHYESFPDGTGQFVENCTYGKNEERGPEDTESESIQSESTQSESIQPESIQQESVTEDETIEFAGFSTYQQPIYLWINAPFEDLGEYYKVTGTLEVPYTISCADFYELSQGDHFIIFDKEFILGELLKTEEFPAPIYSVYCVNDDCTYYLQTKVSLEYGSRFRDDYYTICRSVPDYDTIVESMDIVYSDLGLQEFEISKDTYITSLTEMSDHGYMGMAFEEASEEEMFAARERYRKTDLERFAYSAEECYRDHIFIDDYCDIANFSSTYGEISSPIFCYVIFDENGKIDTIIFDSYG